MSRRNVILLLLVMCTALHLVYLRTEFTKQNNAYGEALKKRNRLDKERYNLNSKNTEYGEESRVVEIAEQLDMHKPRESERVKVY